MIVKHNSNLLKSKYKYKIRNRERLQTIAKLNMLNLTKKQKKSWRFTFQIT